MKKVLYVLLILVVGAGMAFAEGQQEAAEGSAFTLWTQEGEADGALQFVESLAEEFMAANPGVTIEVVNKGTEALREDFQVASLSGEPPELLWTVNDHAGPFVTAGLIQPVGGYYDQDDFVESVAIDGEVWGVPVSTGNHLMLFYNRSLLAEAPENTDEFIEVAQELTDEGADEWGFVYNSTEPFWLVPWLEGFGGTVFAEDGVTPTLDTPAMVDTLQFLYDLEFTYGVIPPELDYAVAEALFLEGQAAMIINGDWTLGNYVTQLGDDLGIARIPRVSETGEWPKPYTSGKYFMIAEDVEGATLELVGRFIDFATSEAQQLRMAEELTRLPARLSVLESDVIAEDPVFAASARQVAVGVPMPSVIEMRANWDAMLPEMNAVLSGEKSPEQAAEDMQVAAEAAIAALEGN